MTDLRLILSTQGRLIARVLPYFPGTVLAGAGISITQIGVAYTFTWDPTVLGGTSVIATGSTAPRTVADRFADVINVRDFGAVGDDAADNCDEIIAALAAAAGKRLYFPPGTYRVPFSAITCFTPGANTEIFGDGQGRSIIKFVPSSTSFRACVDNTNGNLSAKGVTLAVVPPTNGSSTLFAMNGSGLFLDDCELDGGTTNVGATVSTVDSVGINCKSTGTQTDLVVRNCTIHRLRFPLLKAGANTSTQRRIRVLNNTFHSNYNEDLSFNSPNGVMDDIIVTGNTFRDGLGSSASLSQIYLAFATATHYAAADNKFFGTVADAIHIEEACKYSIVSNNDINVDCSNGIFVSDNNIAGVAIAPQFLTVTGNTIKKAGTQKSANSAGINLVYDGSAEVPLKNSVIAENIIDGFESGIYTGQTIDDAVIIANNEIFNCTHGIRSPEGPITASGNLTNGCDTGVSSIDGGTLIGHIFSNCTVNVDATNEAITLIDPVFLFPEFSVGAGSTTNKNTLPLGTTDRCAGFMQIIVTSSANADYTVRQFKVDWNGSVFRPIVWDKGGDAQGGVAAVPLRNSSMLAASIFSTSARTIRAQVRFNGVITVSDTFNTVAGTSSVYDQLSVDQLAFPATQNPSADPNTLDDYEEGSWTPAITFATPGNLSVSYGTQLGRYTKKGREVTAHFEITTSAFTHTTASGNLTITGLPFASSTDLSMQGDTMWQGITKANYTDMSPVTVGATTTLLIVASGSGQNVAAVTAADTPTGGTVRLRGTITYFV
jgi:hypothetical protein